MKNHIKLTIDLPPTLFNCFVPSEYNELIAGGLIRSEAHRFANSVEDFVFDKMCKEYTRQKNLGNIKKVE